MIALVSLAVMGVILLVTAATLYGITLPAKRLTAATRRLAAGALTTRVPQGGVRELDELASAFNLMAAELASAERTCARIRRSSKIVWRAAPGSSSTWPITIR